MVTEETTQTNPSTDTATTQPVETSSPDTSQNTSSNIETNGEEGSTNQTPAAPAYVPNFKLKVYDEEKELDDPFLKNLIKDADSEKKVKEIAQKYLGFDTVKSRHEKVKGEFSQYREHTQPIVEYYSVAQQHLQKGLKSGQLEDFFELVGIPDQAIWSYAVRKAEEAQLPDPQRQQLEHQRQITKERESLANQNQDLMTRQQQQLAEFRNQELNWELSKPNVAPVAQAFDAKNGPGSFRQLVRDKALAHFAATQGREDLSAEQAVSQVMKMIGAFVTPTNNVQPATPGQPQLIQQNEQPPIIPNVQGRSSSPVKKQVRSLDDLKRKREELRSS